MLKRANRLKSRGDFKRTLAGRRLCVNDCFAVYVLFASPGGASPIEPRFGFVVSKKIHKRAVRRNRIRRRLRELVRLALKAGVQFTGYRTVVIIARNASLTANYRNLERHFSHCLKRLEQNQS